MQNKILKFSDDICFLSSGSAVGKHEFEGPIGDCFDIHDKTDRFGMNTWEKAESEMQRLALNVAMSKRGLSELDIDVMFAGDLLNQCVGSSYGLLDFDIPYFGLYGACSTAVEGIMLSAMMASAGYFGSCAAVTSSHNSSAERQYRTPIEYGGQRPPTAQWTVTGSGAFIIGQGDGVRISEALPGIVVEKGIKDANNMGAAMAPAAADTLLRYFKITERSPESFDLILTGDLGAEGGAILCELMYASGYDMARRYNDCGLIIYDREGQDMHSGGSGCGCSAVVLASYILPKLYRGELSDILVVGTGAMMSPASIQQGEAIPAIGHLIRLRRPRTLG
ncbi:MAG: stage V sporulation protein AD [Clostridia bacterium]|nr:stage V sporulation protein AD [Clostridia bacterium]